ncbi:MAG TPA: glycosyltransferase family 39 protein [bacterium]|nr:glycosyltransferase family 39 protein [bacterium]
MTVSSNSKNIDRINRFGRIAAGAATCRNFLIFMAVACLFIGIILASPYFLKQVACLVAAEIANPNTYVLGRWFGSILITLGTLFLVFGIFWRSVRPIIIGLISKTAGLSPRSWSLSIFTVAFLLRLAWVLFIGNESYSDWKVYSQQAADIVSHCQYGYPEPTAFKPPGYHLFLAAIYWLFGINEVAGQISNVFLSSLNCVLLFAIGRKVSNGVGKLASLGLALYPTHIVVSSYLCSDILFTSLLLAVVYIFESMEFSLNRGWYRVIVGIIIAVVSLWVRPILLLFPIALAYYFVRLGISLKVIIKTFLLYAMFYVILFLPWWLRNYLVFERFIWWGTEVQYAVLTTSNEEGMKFISGQAGTEYQNELELTDAMARMGVSHMIGNPWETVKHKAGTWGKFFSPDLEYIVGYQINQRVKNRFMNHPQMEMLKNAIVYIAAGSYVLLLCFFLGGIYFYFRFGPALRFSWTMIIYTVIFTLITYGQQRLRFPIEPLMMLFAALIWKRLLTGNFWGESIKEERARLVGIMS